MPKCDNVIEVLGLGWQFHEMDRPLAPVIPRFNPHSWTALVMRIESLVALRSPLPLQKAKSLHRIIHENRELDTVRIDERPPNVFALAIPDRQAVRVVHPLTGLIGSEAGAWREVEHARKRGNPCVCHGFSGKERAINIHNCVMPSRDDKFISSSDA